MAEGGVLWAGYGKKGKQASSLSSTSAKRPAQIPAIAALVGGGCAGDVRTSITRLFASG